MKLDIEKWKPFITSRLFPVMENGKANQQMLVEGTECFYVGAKKNDNGVMVHCQRDEDLITKGNCLVFICNGQGSVGFANYMDVDFIGTTDIVAGYNEKLNEHIGAFLATIYSQERPKYSFGRKWKTHLKDTEVKLPVQHNADGSYVNDATCLYSDEGYVPDWEFMENYIKSLHYKPLTTKNKVGNIGSLEINNWKSFKVGRIISILNGKGITNDEIEENPGTFNAVQSGEENNGVLGKIDLIYCKKKKYTVSERSCLTVARSGSAGYVSFHPNGCVVGDSAKILLLPEKIASNGVYLFIQTLLTANRFKYAYGRKVTEEKYAEDEIKLPILMAADGTPVIDNSNEFSDEGYIPDWQFMEDYIKSLPYGDRI